MHVAEKSLIEMASENAAMCRVSDEEMRFFQRRARELLLLRREDHAWNDFCKTCTTCDCCSCKRRESTVQEEHPPKPPPKIVKNMPGATSAQNKTLSQTLNEIKSKLEHIDLALSGKTLPKKIYETANQIFPETKLSRSFGQTETLENPTNVKRMELIERCLKQSVQRLQSSAAMKGARPPTKKSRGFFLPHELQQQRTIARNAYLASLSKSKSTLQHSSSVVKERGSNKQIYIQGQVPQTRVIPKTRPKSTLQSKIKEKEKEVAPSQLAEFKDQNIEVAVDGIVDDLMGETVLILNKIKQIKSGTSATLSHHTHQADKEVASKIPSLAVPAGKENTQSRSLHNWAKIRLFNLKTPSEEKSSPRGEPKNSHYSSQEDRGSHLETSKQLHSQSQSTLPKTSVSFASDPVMAKKLLVDPETSIAIERHRREYAKYLEGVAGVKKGSFDSSTLANMISEFLLDECIESVSKELLDVPGSLVTDLYDQEFLQTL